MIVDKFHVINSYQQRKNSHSANIQKRCSNAAQYAFSENKHFFTKSCHHQTYQNYEQSQLGTILGNKVS